MLPCCLLSILSVFAFLMNENFSLLSIHLFVFFSFFPALL
jgi:hypothetical protein